MRSKNKKAAWSEKKEIVLVIYNYQNIILKK